MNLTVNGGPYNNTVENCINACGDEGYAFAGVEFALQCCTCFTWSLG